MGDGEVARVVLVRVVRQPGDEARAAEGLAEIVQADPVTAGGEEIVQQSCPPVLGEAGYQLRGGLGEGRARAGEPLSAYVGVDCDVGLARTAVEGGVLGLGELLKDGTDMTLPLVIGGHAAPAPAPAAAVALITGANGSWTVFCMPLVHRGRGRGRGSVSPRR